MHADLLKRNVASWGELVSTRKHGEPIQRVGDVVYTATMQPVRRAGIDVHVHECDRCATLEKTRFANGVLRCQLHCPALASGNEAGWASLRGAEGGMLGLGGRARFRARRSIVG